MILEYFQSNYLEIDIPNKFKCHKYCYCDNICLVVFNKNDFFIFICKLYYLIYDNKNFAHKFNGIEISFSLDKTFDYIFIDFKDQYRQTISLHYKEDISFIGIYIFDYIKRFHYPVKINSKEYEKYNNCLLNFILARNKF